MTAESGYGGLKERKEILRGSRAEAVVDSRRQVRNSVEVVEMSDSGKNSC